jgi:two-component system, NtrC family, response regulator GlrR
VSADDRDDAPPLPSGAAAATAVLRDHQGEYVAAHQIRLGSVAGTCEPPVALAAATGRVTVGSHDRCDLVIRDATVSRWHCELVVRDGAVVLTDLGSSNGTTVNGVRIERAFLTRGCVIGLGRVRLRFDIEPDALRVAVSSQVRFGELVGEAPASRAAFALLERAAPSDATVLLTGETGTGKEVAARSLHAASSRRDHPLVVVDCASIPDELLESELFGHQRGAFTGAIADRTGAFEAAHRGTILLDEVGELPPALQPKLLRALEAREVKPIGATAYRAVDVRVIAATHRELAAEVAAGRFRADLYYRLAVIEIRLPALRERRADLPHIVAALLDELDASAGDRARLTDPAELAALAARPWPGNVRELRNHLERRLALGDAELPPPPPAEPGLAIDVRVPLRELREQWTRELERRYVALLIEAHRGNVSAAARAAGIDRSHLHRLIARNTRGQ